jgi:hypothetical protein
VTPDDISSIIAFGGNKIGLMWSNQVDQHFYFAVHADGAPPTASAWSASTIPNTLSSDDHINLKADSAGRVYAAVKHSTTSSSDPYLSLLVRSPTGSWNRYTVARVKDGVTRPNVILDEQNHVIHVVYTGPPQSDGSRQILEKTSSMSSISFTANTGATLMRAAAGADFNDVSTAKQNIDGRTGMVVLASDAFANLYWHSDSLAPSSVVDRTPGQPDATPLVGPPPSPPGGQSIHVGGTAEAGDRDHGDARHGGHGAGAAAAASMLSVASPQRGAAVRATLTVRHRGTRVRFLVRARAGHSAHTVVVGEAKWRRVRTGRRRFVIRLNRRAQLALRRLGRIEVTLVVTTVTRGRRPVAATRKIVLRRA